MKGKRPLEYFSIFTDWLFIFLSLKDILILNASWVYIFLSSNAVIGFFASHTFHCVLYSCNSQRGIPQEEKGQVLFQFTPVHMGLTPLCLVVFLRLNNSASKSRAWITMLSPAFLEKRGMFEKLKVCIPSTAEQSHMQPLWVSCNNTWIFVHVSKWDKNSFELYFW